MVWWVSMGPFLTVNDCMQSWLYLRVIKARFPLPIRSTRSSPTKRSGTVIGGGRRSESEDRVDREAIGSPEIGKMSCGGRVLSTTVELGRVWSGKFGDRDDRVDRIGSGNPPSVFGGLSQQRGI
ncbi:hypothetical protein DPMN_088658 [Dreissena polymorpha]|uniref:Uncharacterized protein n=1 Tax=Dreissena polymorpha TaxID=45954 RepID=A0A9D4KW93_DREPO|nr:hypothetical protein DPMN_088658 [Dreissena polymorpha]